MDDNKFWTMFRENEVQKVKKILKDSRQEIWTVSCCGKVFIMQVLLDIDSEIPSDEIASILEKIQGKKCPYVPEVAGFTIGAENVTKIYYNGEAEITLTDFLANRGKSLIDQTKNEMVMKIVVGLYELKQINIIHGRLDTDSILLDYMKEPLIIGYGIHELLRVNTNSVFFDKNSDPKEPSFESDIYSLGYVACYLLCGSNPTRELRKSQNQPLQNRKKDLRNNSDDNEEEEEESDDIGTKVVSLNMKNLPSYVKQTLEKCWEESDGRIDISTLLDRCFSSEFCLKDSAINSLFELQAKIMPPSFIPTKIVNLSFLNYFQTQNIVELTTVNRSLTNEITSLRKIVYKGKTNDNKINEIEQRLNLLEQRNERLTEALSGFMDKDQLITLPLDNQNNGILAYLINSQDSFFDKTVVTRQSSGDVWEIIDENTFTNYSSGSGDYEWVQFEFPEEISVTSFYIKSAHRSFLRTWNFVAYDNQSTRIVLHEAVDDQTLNGKYKETKINVKATSARVFRIEKNGPNWSNTNFFRLKHVELYSDNPKYLGGVFKTLLKESNGDSHHAKVNVTASNFDFRHFHEVNPSKSLCTLDDPELPWIQFELTKGKAVITGYRMQQLTNWPFGSWSVQGSNKGKTDSDDWTVIHRVNTEEKFKDVIVQSCRSDGAFKYFRLVCETPPPDNDVLKLRLRHFDIFGSYIPDVAK